MFPANGRGRRNTAKFTNCTLAVIKPRAIVESIFTTNRPHCQFFPLIFILIKGLMLNTLMILFALEYRRVNG